LGNIFSGTLHTLGCKAQKHKHTQADELELHKFSKRKGVVGGAGGVAEVCPINAANALRLVISFPHSCMCGLSVCYLLIKHESEFGEQICSNTLQANKQTNRQTNRLGQTYKSLKNKAKQAKGNGYKK